MDYVVFDLETTGLSPERDAIVEIGAVVVRNGEIVEDEIFHSLVNPQRPIPYFATKVHGLKDMDVKHAPTIDLVLPEFLAFIKRKPLVAHNISFDVGFIQANAQKLGLEFPPRAQICTMQLSRRAYPRERSHKLDLLASRLDLTFTERHRSMGDVQVTAQAFIHLSRALQVNL